MVYAFHRYHLNKKLNGTVILQRFKQRKPEPILSVGADRAIETSRSHKFNLALIVWRQRVYGFRLPVALFGCVVFAFLVGAQGQAGSAAETRDLQSIVNDGVLRVAMTRFDLPGFHQSRPDGSVAGLEADLARALAQALNVKVALNADYGSFDGVADAVATGRADIGLSKLSQTYYRVLHVRFSQPYVTLHHALLYERVALANAANGRTPEEVLREFRGKIGVIAGSAYVDFGHRNFPEAQIVALGSWDEVVLALKQHRVEAIYRDEFEVRRVLRNNPALNVQFGAAIVTDQKAFLSIAICDTCSKLQQFINYHLEEYPRAYTVDQLLDLANQN